MCAALDRWSWLCLLCIPQCMDLVHMVWFADFLLCCVPHLSLPRFQQKLGFWLFFGKVSVENDPGLLGNLWVVSRTLPFPRSLPFWSIHFNSLLGFATSSSLYWLPILIFHCSQILLDEVLKVPNDRTTRLRLGLLHPTPSPGFIRLDQFHPRASLNKIDLLRPPLHHCVLGLQSMWCYRSLNSQW